MLRNVLKLLYAFKNYQVTIQREPSISSKDTPKLFKNYQVTIQQAIKNESEYTEANLKTTKLLFNWNKRKYGWNIFKI